MLTTRMPLAQPPSRLVQIRRAQLDSEADRGHKQHEQDPGLSHTSPIISLTSGAGTTSKSPGDDLNSNNEIDVLAKLQVHYLPDGTVQYPDSNTMETLESAYHGSHTTREEQHAGEVPQEWTEFHPVPSPQCPEEEELEGSTVKVSLPQKSGY